MNPIRLGTMLWAATLFLATCGVEETKEGTGGLLNGVFGEDEKGSKEEERVGKTPEVRLSETGVV